MKFLEDSSRLEAKQSQSIGLEGYYVLEKCKEAGWNKQFRVEKKIGDDLYMCLFYSVIDGTPSRQELVRDLEKYENYLFFDNHVDWLCKAAELGMKADRFPMREIRAEVEAIRAAHKAKP